MTFGDRGFETMAMQDAEWTEHDWPTKRYDKKKPIDRFTNK